MKVLVSIVGNPSNWKMVEYSMVDEKGEGRSVVSSVSSHAISEVVKPDMSIVIGLDTLAELENIPHDYNAVVESSKTMISESFKNVGWRGFEIEISPGVGKFGNNAFGGDPLDFYFFTFMKLFERLKDERDVELHLDITHGINYTMNMTYRAVVDILSSISLRGGRVKLTVYNSEPVSLGANHGPEREVRVNIHRIEKRVINPDFLIGKIEGDVLRWKGRSEASLNRKAINSIISCFENMLVMPYRYILEHTGIDMEKISKNIGKIYMSSISVGDGTVKKGAVFTRNVYPFMKALAYDHVFRSLGLSYPVDVKEVKDMVKSMSKSNKFGTIVVDEISKIIKASASIPEGKWILLGRVKKGDEFDESKAFNQISERNFLAHGGMEMNSTEIMKKDGRLLARYSENAHERIMDVISRLGK